MPCFRSLVFGFSLAAGLVATAPAATSPRVAAQPQARIFKHVDNAEATLRPRTTTPMLARATDQGRIGADTPFKHMMLVLRNTDEQEFALASLLDQQQDKASPNYHQWMTPETFGATFGVAGSDLAQVTAWLQDSGFIVEQVTRGARIIEFSGTSGQIEATFHTQMHRYLLNGESHLANSTDISIPSALAGVVVGVASLNDFNPRSQLINPRKIVLSQQIPQPAATSTPDYTSATSGTHYVGAGDLATLFNTQPLLNAGIDGTGVTIGIIAQTNILLSDVRIYRSLFHLPQNDPTFIQVGGDPGTNADDGESDLDVELSGALAPGASIHFVTSGNSYFGGGIDAAAVYLVDNNSADIISLSYGLCEASLGSSGPAFYGALWEQAASQGQTVFVSSGDSGPSTCNDADAPYSTTGYGVNGLGSTPYNVAVGGSMFSEGSTAAGATPYWGAAAGPPYSTALSYIPEIPWNESAFDMYPGGYGGIVAAGSGISRYYPTPSFQAGPGVPTSDPTPNSGTVTGFVVPGPHRYVPDLVLEAAGGHDGTIYCSEGSCMLNPDGTVAGIGVVGGTSVAAPSMAGVQALINQKNGGRQGNANYYYYRVAATQNQANCVAATYLTLADATCGFHDITTGNLNIPSNASQTAFVGWSAGPGYDLAVGLGSPDATNLATRWSTVTFNATTTAFTLNPTTGLTHGDPQTFTLAVTPISGTGTPTGDVSIIANTTSGGGVHFYTLSNAAASGTLTGLPAGTYTVYAHYAGDATYGGSNSAPISVSIAPENSILTATSYLLATNGTVTATTSFPYGANVYLDARIAGASATGTPTGRVTFALTRGTTPLTPYVGPLDSFADAYLDAGLGYEPYLITPTAPVLSPGTYAASISYSGDTSFNPSSATSITFTVTPIDQPLALTAATTQINSGATATLNASIATVSPAAGGVPASGTVTFTDTTTNTVLGTGTLANGAVVFTTNAITTLGSHSITASYPGDTNYLSRTSAAVTVTVGAAPSSVALAVSPTTAQVGTSITLTATTPIGSSGSVTFYDNSVSLGASTISTSTLTATLTLSTFTAGTHTLTATSSGNSTQVGATSTAVILTLTKNTPTLQLTAQQSDPNSSTISINATLIPSPRGPSGNNPPPTGAVQFLDGTTVLGTATSTYLPGGSNNYVATFTTPALRPGPHTLTATYVGDANFAPYTSNAQTIDIGLTTPTLTTSTTSIGTGTAFTLTDRIVPQVASAPTVTGTVTFYDATTTLGTSSVINGTATLSTAVLIGVGSHSITAVYSGDTNFYTSTTAATIITVVQAAATPTLTLSTAAAPFGTAVILTATTPGYSTGTVTFLDNGVALRTITLTGTTPAASLTLTNLAPRSHSITAAYSGDTNFLPGTSASAILTVTQLTATPILTASATTVQLGTSVTLIATTPSTPAASTGTITFLDNGIVIGTSTLAGATPTASLATAALSVGIHSLTVTYSGDSNFLPGTSTPTTLTVTPASASTTLTLSSSTIKVGSPITLTAITPTIPAVSTGIVTFLDNGIALASAPLAGANPTASLTLTNLAARTHSLTAAYSGDTNFLPATSTATILTVTQNTPSLQLATLQSASAATPITLNTTLSPVPTGTRPNVPAPTGSVQYTDGSSILGTAPLSAFTDGSANYAAPFPVTLRPGQHTVAATYLGDNNYASASTAAQTISLGLTAIALTTSATTVGLGTPFQLTARITPVISGTTSIGGMVTFSDGATVLGTSSVSSGTATAAVTLTSTASPTHALTAAYSGDANFFPSTAAAITVTAVTPGVSVSVNPASLTITRGSSGSAMISVTTTGNYSGTVTPTCTGLPSLATCTFGPTSLTFNGANGTQTTTVMITATAPVVSSSFLWLPAFILAGLIAARRRQLGTRSRHLLTLVVTACGLLAVSGCGAAVSKSPTATGGTPAGTSTVTLNFSAVGSTSASPSLPLTSSLSVTVQ